MSDKFGFLNACARVRLRFCKSSTKMFVFTCAIICMAVAAKTMAVVVMVIQCSVDFALSHDHISALQMYSTMKNIRYAIILALMYLLLLC